MSEIDLLESKQNKLVINIFGAPGVGKSTLAKNLQEFMQKQGYGSYLVEEFATKLIKENRIDELKDQIFVSQNQANMIKFGLDQSNLVICDSPLQLGKIYNSDYTKENKVSNLIDYAEKNYTSIDLFLQHDSQTEKTYTMQGRVHTLEESKFKEKELLAILHGKKLIFASRDMDLETLFIKIKNTDEFKNFTKELKMEKEKLINLYKENNAEHFQNEERFKKIEEETSIEMGDPYGEYRYEVKENQKNEELALYYIEERTESNELMFRIITLNKEDSNSDEKVTDLIEIKKALYWESQQCDLYSKQKFRDFAKKVDEKLIEHICEKYYSGYENAEKDQEFFKQSKVAYDDNGFIKGIQAIGYNGWLDISSSKNLDSLDTLFKNEYFAKKHNLYEICDLLDDGLGTSERRVGFFPKDEVKDFIAKDETGITTRAYEYKIYNSDGDVTEVLKNEVRNELLNQNSEFEESNETNHKRKRR
nr:AAA family ATPase [Campylobacter sp.]